jgi:menaquinone-specific isochorismate synthase
LPFDTEQTPTEAWGELGEGWFYLPSILFTFSGSRIYGTLNFSGSSEQEVEERWSSSLSIFVSATAGNSSQVANKRSN